ncbi:hypothetical protein [Hymenobacter cellulosilyticus]|uniref:Uncharacterized protein n=1 Tax=Hymenobacter cellulosilyticus TaxID=2932248 RepID=A0A8T9Q7L2_9BACT|nr:hypothetical protein [Hymenobacter cellulosilyticus]UOQ71499.1 hypothetical protein MUN79_23240 [Hymenobacter cellulosilyticus]
MTNYIDFEEQLIKGFKLQNIINFQEYLLDLNTKFDLLIILDNFETVVNIDNKDEFNRILNLLEFATDYANIIITSRETLGVDFEDVFNLSSMTTDDAVILFEKYYGKIDEDEMLILRSDVLENILNNNPLAIKLVTRNTVKQSILNLKEQLIDSFFEITSTDFDKIYNKNADLNIERTKSIYQSINYSYSKLSSKEKLAFELLHLFPDGIGLSDFKKCFAKNSGSNRISDSELRSLQNKSLVENYDGVLQLQPIVRRFAEFQFSKKSSDVKRKYYNNAYQFNVYLIQYLNDVYTLRDINAVYKMQNLVKNNLSLVLEYIPYIEVADNGVVTNKKQLLSYVNLLSHYVVSESQVNKIRLEIVNLKGYFSDVKYADKLLDANIAKMTYYLENFDTSYVDIVNLLTVEEMGNRKIDTEDDIEKLYKNTASAIHSMEGYTLKYISNQINYNVSEANRSLNDHLFYLGIHDEVKYLPRRFYSFERDYVAKKLDVEVLEKYIENIFSEYHLEVVQCTYVLSKIKSIPMDKIKRLVVTNPYTKGLKELMMAFNEEDNMMKRNNFLQAIKYLYHIKYYYLEALYYYCKYLKKMIDPEFDIVYQKGLDLCVEYRYQYMEFRFKSINSVQSNPYVCSYDYYGQEGLEKFVIDYIKYNSNKAKSARL